MIKTVIWDLDGTLLDTLEDLADATNYVLGCNGLPTRSLDEIRQFVGNGVRKLIERSLPPDTPPETLRRVFADFKAYYEGHISVKTHPYPGIPETLTALREKGVRMAIVSNKLEDAADTLRRQFFADTVETAVGDCPPRPVKPAPDGTFEAMRRLNADPQTTLYIGDSDVDIATAKNAGLPCISALWGFRDEAFLRQSGAVDLARTPADVLRFI